jgi:hypothetical protein
MAEGRVPEEGVVAVFWQEAQSGGRSREKKRA